MERNPLLDSYLRQLRLPTFTKLYPQLAADAAHNNHDSVRFLLALAEQEVNQRQLNMLQQRLKNARFPVIKELADFDFSCLPCSTSPKFSISRAANTSSKNRV